MDERLTDTIDEALSVLTQSGIEEPSLRLAFSGYRPDRLGKRQQIYIDVTFAGDGSDRRFHASAKAADSTKTATGNGGTTVRLALINVHWDDLD